VTACTDKAGTDASLKVARDWIQKKASNIHASPPIVTEGPVIVQPFRLFSRHHWCRKFCMSVSQRYDRPQTIRSGLLAVEANDGQGLITTLQDGHQSARSARTDLSRPARLTRDHQEALLIILSGPQISESGESSQRR
jgi:hypothetical protein